MIFSNREYSYIVDYTNRTAVVIHIPTKLVCECKYNDQQWQQISEYWLNSDMSLVNPVEIQELAAINNLILDGYINCYDYTNDYKPLFTKDGKYYALQIDSTLLETRKLKRYREYNSIQGWNFVIA